MIVQRRRHEKRSKKIALSRQLLFEKEKQSILRFVD